MALGSGVAPIALSIAFAGTALFWGSWAAQADHQYNGPGGGFYGGFYSPAVSFYVPSVPYSFGPPKYYNGAPAYRYRGYDPRAYPYSYPYRWQYRYDGNK
jgi:hypothetical protein